MLKSIYKTKDSSEVSEELKKKLLKTQLEQDVPSTEELDAEIEGNKPAYTKKQVEASNNYKDREIDQITGGNYTEIKGKASVDTENPDRTIGNKIADGAIAGAGGLMDMTATVMAQKGPMNKQQRKANTMNLGMKGAKTGAAIGTAFGPVGTLIGAGAGLVAGVGTGLIQGIGDEKELQDQAKLERVAYLDDVKDERKRAQKLDEGKKVLEKNKNVLQAQMGLLGSKYSNSKIG